VTTTPIEVRCPEGPQRLLMKMRQNGEKPVYVEGMLIELACSDCRRTEKMHGRPVPLRVLHRFDLLGTLVETLLVWTDSEGPD
jgi:hypothetical protein